MPLPELQLNGDLPPGVHAATLAEVVAKFGGGTEQRRIVAARLVRIHGLAASTKQLKRFVVFGSFVSAKPKPRDVDVVMVMAREFNVETVAPEAKALFRHLDAEVQLGASVFWCTELGAFGGDQTMIEHWQIRREGGLRGIIEVVEEQ